MNLSGLCNVNIELTDRCNKKCWMCGRRKREKENPDIIEDYGDMKIELVKKIANQLPPGIVVQLHNNGEPLVYPEFGRALDLFNRQITNIVTNGKLLIEKSKQIIGKLDTLAISVIQNDTKVEASKQFSIIKRFLRRKGDRKPLTILRLNGDVNEHKYRKFKIPIAKRILHSPMGSFDYVKAIPTVPEIGICLDFLHHLAINRKGEVSICVRFDPYRLGVIGDANVDTLEDIWNSPERLEWKCYHKYGRREKVPLCACCDFWGVPTGG